MKNIIKKLIVLSCCLLVVFAAVKITHVTHQAPMNDATCAFCNPEILQTQTFYQDEYVRGLCPNKPMEDGHCLIITKRHIRQLDQATDEELLAMGKLIKKINTIIQRVNGPSSYIALQKNGAEVGQTVPHVHIHYIPRKITHKSYAVMGLLSDILIEPFQQPINTKTLIHNVALMKKQFEDPANYNSSFPQATDKQ